MANMDLKDCKTVEEVEQLRCKDCAATGHWGWCDAPWIMCEYRDKIKEILGKQSYRYMSLKEQSLDLKDE